MSRPKPGIELSSSQEGGASSNGVSRPSVAGTAHVVKRASVRISNGDEAAAAAELGSAYKTEDDAALLDVVGDINMFGTSAGPPRVQYWAWLQYSQFEGQKLLLWWVGLLFLIGAAFFTFVGVTELSYYIVVENFNGYNSLAAWLVYYPCAIGAIAFFWTASLVNLVEALNQDHNDRVDDWRAAGAFGDKPRMRVVGAELTSVYWWAAVVQVFGTSAFGVASIFGIVSLGVPIEVGSPAMKWFQWFPYAFGGCCFLLAGWLFTISTTGSLWRGILPLRRSDRHSLAYWSMCFYFWGSVGFCLSGWFFYTSPWLPWHWWVLQQAIGYLLGSFLFFVSAAFTLLLVSNPGHA